MGPGDATPNSTGDHVLAVIVDHKHVPEGADGPFHVFGHRLVVRVVIPGKKNLHPVDSFTESAFSQALISR
jgi:hypothetical protein